ncbi:MAG TPA: thiamine pyrophosphate-dependent dehydrogenase E1 component subunit alpha [Chondromyces sp.]|nr:thiamine pyrophosphate-dependent dehydrogenase E1 component subunit alpha [Chondromyces sp.]
MTISIEKKIAIYEKLYLARRFEDELLRLFSENKITGWVHSNKGHEAIGVSLGLALRETDYFVPHHRDRPAYLARGLEAKKLFAEIMGKKTGCCGGIGGEIHIMDVKTRIYGSTGVLGSNMPIATGIAYTSLLSDRDDVVICNFGEGGSNRGAFHEALNMASLWSLPVIFICENNLYSEFTSVEKHMKIKNIADRAISYGMEGIIVDGFNPEECFEAISGAIENARNGKGPTLIEAKLYRLDGHYEGDPMNYRSKEEFESWLKRDPLVVYRNELLNSSVVTIDNILKIEGEVNKEIEKAIEYALNSDFPNPEDTFVNVYANGGGI